MDNYFYPKFKIDSLSCGRNDIVELLHQKLAVEINATGQPGERLIPAKLLAEKLVVAPQTVRKAYEKLEHDGLVVHPSGKRCWQINSRVCAPRCLGIILPASFISYFQPGTTFGQRHFRMYSGLVDRAGQLGYATIPVNLPPPDAAPEVVTNALRLIARQYCGIIHFGERGFDCDPPLSQLLHQPGLAQIALNCEFTVPEVGAVTFDPQVVVKIFVQHLTELGHSRFGFVKITDERVKNPYIHYLMINSEELTPLFEQAGVAAENFRFGDLQSNDHVPLSEQLRQYLAAPHAPTALLCRNDETAIKVIKMLQHLGYRVPEDISVVGFNNLAESEKSNPPLTTFYNPLYELGSVLVDQLELYLKKGINSTNRLVRVPPQLVLRHSTGPCRLDLPY